MRFALNIALTIVISLALSCSSSKQSSSSAGSASRSSAKLVDVEMLDENTFKLTSISDDPEYGYTEKKAIKVGGAYESGPVNERKFLNALLGPNGEKISYERLGSCCPFDTKNGIMGGGLLDRYSVTYAGLAKPIIILINMYDPGVLQAPKGFTFRQ